MKKLIIIFMTVFISIVCQAKEVALDQLFTEDSGFGVKPGMTYDELSKVIKLEKIANINNITLYRSTEAPLQNNLFSEYSYYFNMNNQIIIVGGIKEIHNVEKPDGSKVQADYDKLVKLLNKKFSIDHLDDSCSEPLKYKDGKLLSKGDNQEDYNSIRLCRAVYDDKDKQKIHVAIMLAADLKNKQEGVSISYMFNDKYFPPVK